MVRTLWLLRGLHGGHNTIERDGEVVEMCFDMLRKLRTGSRSGPFRLESRGELTATWRATCLCAKSREGKKRRVMQQKKKA
jgi:hypothetical protein